MTHRADVTGTGSASATPDLVSLDVRVAIERPDVAAALAELATRLSVALAAAADHGVADADRRTTSMTVAPCRDPEGREVTGYRAAQSVRLRVRERARVGDVLAALAGAAGDALEVEGISLDVADRTRLLEQARAAAFADARATATQYAELAGRALGPVLRVDEGPDPGTPAPRARMAALASGAGVPVEAGEATVRVTVAVRFALGAS